MNAEKTISCKSRGMVISYGNVKKHLFVNYETKNQFVNKIQTGGTSKYQSFEKVHHFTLLQQEIYDKTVYGFNAYTQEEIDSMSKGKRYRVAMVYTKARRILNRWKQEIINEKMDSFLIRLFPNSPIVKQMIRVKGYDDNLDVSNITFRSLGISEQMIANKLIEYGFLPNNFYQIA
jgi:hypothetical protein